MEIVSETSFERGFSNTFIQMMQNKSMEKMAIESNTKLNIMAAFSNTYVPDKEIALMDLQFIEGGELERTWKHARRERLKVQQDKIWAEFVKEKDQVLQAVHQEDKYQFIDTVPEECLKELLDSETSRSKTEQSQEEANAAGDSQDTSRSVSDGEDNVFHIFDEDTNDLSGDNEEALDDAPGTPSTVRESLQLTNRADRPITACNEVTVEAETAKSEKNTSEANMVNMIESSIHCAKVKELRTKIKDELQAMITSLEGMTVGNVDPFELVKMRGRAAEYATRFQRIHLYQVTRAIHDLQRHNEQALPFAKHTQFQSQMVRIVSLHTNMLQAVQAFHKSLEQTACLDASSTALRALCAALQQGTTECLAVPLPAPTVPANELYHDGLDALCDQMVTCVTEYNERVADILRAADIAVQHAKRGERSKVKKKSNNAWSRTATKNTASHSGSMGRLSMYSMETIKANPKLKHAQSTVKKIINGQHPKKDKPSDESSKKDKSPRSNRKTPRSRRPLMRAAVAPRARRPDVEPLPLVDTDLHTMVEAVDAESTASPVASPLTRRQPRTSRSQNEGSRKEERSPNVSPTAAPHSKPHPGKLHTPKGNKETHTSPTRSNLPTTLSLPRGVPESERTVCDVNTILRQLCGGDVNGSRTDRSVGNAKNAQLLYMKSSSSPRQPTTPQLLKILEETIQKKVPKCQESDRARNKKKDRDEERLRLSLNTPQHVADSLTQYRTKFVQHMLTSNMYANSAVGLPWEKIGSIADDIISEVLVACAWEMELVPMVTQLYLAETTAE